MDRAQLRGLLTAAMDAGIEALADEVSASRPAAEVVLIGATRGGGDLRPSVSCGLSRLYKQCRHRRPITGPAKPCSTSGPPPASVSSCRPWPLPTEQP